MIVTTRYQAKQEARRAEMAGKVAELGLTVAPLPGGKLRVFGNGIDVWVSDLAALDDKDINYHR